jgi:Fic family protein
VVALHDRVLAGKFGLGAGRFRTAPTFIVNSASHEVVFTPPDHAVVPVLVDEACMRMEESDMHPGVAAGWIHATVACIHPFADGNGRIARVLSSLAMYRGGFKRPEFTSLEEWWGRHLRDYYASFACFGDTFDAGADPTPFLKVHLEAQLHQVRALHVREQVEERIWIAAESVAEQAGLQARVANALWDAFFGREVSSRYYRPLADVSSATAASDLTTCASAGLLAPIGAGRSRRYVDGPQLYAAIGRELGVEVHGGATEARAQIVERLSRGPS